MGVKAYITDLLGQDASIKNGKVKGDKPGLVVYSSPQSHWTTTSIPFLSSAGSPLLNVDGSSSGATEGIHDGTDSVLWTASALSGVWDFASTTQANSGAMSVDATATIDGDQAQFERASSIDSADFATLTGAIYLTKYNATRNSIPFNFLLAGTPVGIDINLGDFINTATLNSWQSFTVPLSDFVLVGDIDQMVVETATTSGSPPGYYLDDLNLRAGGGEVFTAQVPKDRTFRLTKIEVTFRDDIDLFATVGANETATAWSINPGGIMGLPELSNGLAVRSVVDGVTGQSAVLRNMADMLYTVFSISDVFAQGTDAIVKLESSVPTMIFFDGAQDDRVELVISDDMTGLTDFRAILRGDILEE